MMNALERELETAMGLASCRGDEDKIKEAMLELSHLRSSMAVLRDSAKDVIQWADDTGHDCYQMHRLNAAIALSFTPGARFEKTRESDARLGKTVAEWDEKFGDKRSA